MSSRSCFWAGFTSGLVLFVGLNLITVHLRSDFGLLEGLGIVDRGDDDVRRIGFPFLVLEEGGFSWHRAFNPLALILDLALGLGGSIGVGFVAALLQKKLLLRQRSKRGL